MTETSPFSNSSGANLLFYQESLNDPQNQQNYKYLKMPGKPLCTKLMLKTGHAHKFK